jgi:membrane-associated phospholipid phosphatase
MISLEWLIELDKILFILVNSELANPVTDFISPIITSDMNLRVSYAVIMILLLWKGSPRVRWMVLFSVLTMLVADQISSNFLKEIFQRPRPCQIMSDLRLLVDCGSGYAMPSSHAANSFAQAAFFGTLVPKSRWYLIVLAFLISVSRVFVGVHYPGDVLVGTILGVSIGLLMAVIFVPFERKVAKRVVPNRNS